MISIQPSGAPSCIQIPPLPLEETRDDIHRILPLALQGVHPLQASRFPRDLSQLYQPSYDTSISSYPEGILKFSAPSLRYIPQFTDSDTYRGHLGPHPIVFSYFSYSSLIDISFRYGACRRSMDPDHFSEKLVSWRACHIAWRFQHKLNKDAIFSFSLPYMTLSLLSSYEMEASSSSRKLTPHTPHETPVEESGSYWQTSGEQSSTLTAIQVEGSNHSLVGNRDERKVWI